MSTSGESSIYEKIAQWIRDNSNDIVERIDGKWRITTDRPDVIWRNDEDLIERAEGWADYHEVKLPEEFGKSKGWINSYVALYVPASEDNDPSAKGFDTEGEAWMWIGEHGICPSCKEDVERGGYFEEFEGDKEWIEVRDAYDTPCGAEWMVISEDDCDPEELATIRFYSEP